MASFLCPFLFSFLIPYRYCGTIIGMTISNEKEFLAKHGFKSREAYNKKQRAIFEKKINPFNLRSPSRSSLTDLLTSVIFVLA